MNHSSNVQQARQRGLTLIELMVAMVLGLLVLAGVGTIFLSTSSSVKALDQLVALQESGRFAIAKISDDISMTNAQYCSGSGGNARPSSTNIALDDLRAPKVYAKGAAVLNAIRDVTTNWGAPYSSAPTKAFAMPEYLSARGYDCTASSCTPVDPHTLTAIPEQGTAIGKRVVGSSILTVRYLDSNMGWSIGHPGGSSITSAAGGKVNEITIAPLAHEPPASDFGDGHLAMLSDCSLSQVFAVTGQGSNTLELATSNNYDTPSAMTGTQALHLFDFNRAFKTVTYYLQVVEARAGDTTGALIRRINGDDQEMVRGIERLNFRYGVMGNDGRTKFLTAAQVDNAAPSDCPWTQPDDALGATNPKGCLWRALMSVEINLLASGQTPLHNLKDEELAYSYGDKATPDKPSAHAIKPDTDQGFPEKLLRREFSALVAIRNYNP